MKQLPVSDETFARCVELQEVLGATSDTVVGLALEQLAIVLDEVTASQLSTYPVLGPDDARAAVELVLRHRWRWQTLAYTGKSARRVLDEVERG